MKRFKTCTRDFKGAERRFFLVDVKEHSLPSDAPANNPAHEIMLVDASGSMYYDLPKLRDLLIQYLTLEKHRRDDIKVTLMSYSTQGDLVIHFSQVTLADLLRLGSTYQAEIRKLKVRGLTCISQALQMAKAFIRPGEDTAIVLHSDGYANHPSPRSERTRLLELATELSAIDGVFIDTVAYRDWADYKLLSQMANIGSGKCTQAHSSDQVFEALRGTAEALSGGVVPALEIPVEAGSYAVFVSADAQKVIGGTETFQVKGLTPGQSGTAYRFYEVDGADWNGSQAALLEDDDDSRRGLYAYARAKLAEGDLMEAKYALAGAGDSYTLSYHGRALTNTQVRDFAGSLEQGAYGNLQTTGVYGIPNQALDIVSLVNLLRKEPGALSVDTVRLRENYTRRGVKKLQGRRMDDGSVEKPAFDLRFKGRPRWVKVSGFDMNHDTASLQMRLVYPAKLVNVATGKTVKRVAGVDVSQLRDFRNYTLVGDGEVNVPELRVKISSKRLHRTLVRAGLLAGDFAPTKVHTINLDQRPVVAYGLRLDPAALGGVFTRLAELKVVASMVRALLPGESAVYSSEQVAALKEHHLSPALYYSAPSTVPYTDRDDAIAKGRIDIRLSYRVVLGTHSILHVGKMPSANAYMKKRFNITLAGNDKPEKAPKMPMVWETGSEVTLKRLTKRTENGLGPVDELVMPLMANFLSVTPNGSVKEVLGTEFEDLADELHDATKSGDKETAIEVLTEMKSSLEDYMEDIWGKTVVPLAFYLGASGLLPEGFEDAEVLDSEALLERFGSLKLSKAELDGTFFVLGDHILSVFTDQVDFSTGR